MKSFVLKRDAFTNKFSAMEHATAESHSKLLHSSRDHLPLGLQLQANELHQGNGSHLRRQLWRHEDSQEQKVGQDDCHFSSRESGKLCQFLKVINFKTGSFVFRTMTAGPKSSTQSRNLAKVCFKARRSKMRTTVQILACPPFWTCTFAILAIAILTLWTKFSITRANAVLKGAMSRRGKRNNSSGTLSSTKRTLRSIPTVQKKSQTMAKEPVQSAVFESSQKPAATENFWPSICARLWADISYKISTLQIRDRWARPILMP